MSCTIRSAWRTLAAATSLALAACSSPSTTYINVYQDGGAPPPSSSPDASTVTDGAVPTNPPADAGADAKTNDGGSGLDGASPSRAAISCKQIRDDGYARGRGVYWLNPEQVGGAAAAFPVDCDMIQDDGGWTMIGRGRYWLIEVDGLDASSSNAMLKPALMTRVLGVTGRQFRAGSGPNRLYIRDTDPVLAVTYHYWRTNAASVECTTSYAAVVGNTMVTSSTKQMRDDPLAIANHINTTSTGWILLHAADTFNASGEHPCAFGVGLTPTSSSLGDLWVR